MTEMLFFDDSAAGMPELTVNAALPALRDEAEQLARELGLPLDERARADGARLSACLELTSGGLWLRPLGGDGTGPVQVDFGAGRMRHRRRGGHNESLGRAVGAGKRSPLSVIDATAGLGKDSFVLADLGCEVVMLERAVAAFALLRDGLHRARSSGDPWLEAVSARLSLWRVDALEWLATHPRSADVVYLDPMFPVRKKSARTKKDMWLLNSMTGPDADQDSLLPAALDAARWRVVVKRPAKAPPLAERKAHHSIEGKTVRFDVYNAFEI